MSINNHILARRKLIILGLVLNILAVSFAALAYLTTRSQELRGRATVSNVASSEEAENSTLSGPVAVGNDNTASGGKYIVFNSTVPTTSPSTSPPSPTPSTSPPPPTPSTPPLACETRGVWLNPPAFKTPAARTTTFNNIVRANLNTVFMITYPLNGNWGSADKASFDTMYSMLRQAGIHVHAWIDSFKRINGDPTLMDYSKSSEWNAQAQWALDFLNNYPDMSGVFYDNIRYYTGNVDQVKTNDLYNTVKTIHDQVKASHPNKLIAFYGSQVDPTTLTSGFYQPQWWKNWLSTHPNNLLKFNGAQYRPENLKYDHLGWVINGWMDAFMPGDYTTSVELWKRRIDIWKDLWDGPNSPLLDKIYFGLPWMPDKPSIVYPDGKSYPGGGANPITAVQQIYETRAAGFKGIVIFQFGKQSDDTPLVDALANGPFKEPIPTCFK